MIAIPIFIAALILLRLIFIFAPKPVTKRAPSLPGHGWKIIYTDNAKSSAKAKRDPDAVYGKILKDPANRLQGKPDFIYSNGRDFIPVELKSGRVGDASSPRTGDMMQLAVYFFLIEAEYGARPREGRLVYADAMFVIKNTRQIRNAVTDIVDEMEDLLSDAVRQDSGGILAEPDFNKCRHCSCRGTVCETEKNT